jgi:hypothetical protein
MKHWPITILVVALSCVFISTAVKASEKTNAASDAIKANAIYEILAELDSNISTDKFVLDDLLEQQYEDWITMKYLKEEFEDVLDENPEIIAKLDEVLWTSKAYAQMLRAAQMNKDAAQMDKDAAQMDKDAAQMDKDAAQMDKDAAQLDSLIDRLWWKL